MFRAKLLYGRKYLKEAEARETIEGSWGAQGDNKRQEASDWHAAEELCAGRSVGGVT